MQKPFPAKPTAFLWLYALKNKKLILLIAASLTVYLGFSKLVLYIFSQMIGLFGETSDYTSIKHQLWFLLFSFILVDVLTNLSQFMTQYFSIVKLWPTALKQMGTDLFSYLSGHSIEYFADNMAGALATKVNQVAAMASNLYVSLMYYIISAGSLLFTFFMLAFVNLSLAFLFLAGISASIFAFLYFGKYTVSQRTKMSEARSLVAGNCIDALQNSFFVKIFNGTQHEIKRARDLFENERKIVNKSVITELTQSDGQELYFKLLYLLFLFYSFYLWKNSLITGADLVLIFLLLERMGATASHVIHRAILYNGEFADLANNLIPFATAYDLTDAEDAKRLKVSQGRIEINNISFGYKKGNQIFKDFSLKINPNEKVGIVGLSGGGKTTLINLIQRFYDINNGAILIDGQNIRQVTQDSLHQNISFVSQTNNLLEQTVAENIAYGKINASLKQIKAAAKNAYADNFINELPQKYKTVINGENKLSGGQIQRLSIARALLKDAPILILDEATSALDSESEDYIQKAIETLIKGKTVLAVAHRLSTLKNMDRIIVLHKGKIIEDGTIQELLARKGKFAEFWKLQTLKGNLND